MRFTSISYRISVNLFSVLLILISLFGDNVCDICNQDLYNNIKKEPFRIPEDDGNDLMHTFFNPVKEGWLSKQGN